MVGKTRKVTNTERLSAQAAQVRLKAVESQLKMALTLCRTAKIEIRSGEHLVARKLLRRLRHHANEIRVHLEEPGHVPRTALAGLRTRLARLERQNDEISALLRQQ